MDVPSVQGQLPFNRLLVLTNCEVPRVELRLQGRLRVDPSYLCALTDSHVPRMLENEKRSFKIQQDRDTNSHLRL